MSSPSFAERFERILVPTIFRPWGGALLDRIRPAPTERVLDVGCGTGIVARLVRERCGSATRIVGVDVNPEMIAVARSIAPDIEWHQGNAIDLPFPARSFDLVLAQQVLQFLPDRRAGMKEMRRMTAAGGRIAFSTWRPIEENPLFLALHQLAATRFGEHLDRRFSFGDAADIVTMLHDAGFRGVHIETLTRIERVPDAAQFVAMNLAGTIDALDQMREAERAQAIALFQAEARKAIAPFIDGAGLTYPVSANVVIAAV